VGSGRLFFWSHSKREAKISKLENKNRAMFGLNRVLGVREVMYENNTNIPPKKTKNKTYLNQGVKKW
jgi:hypothetical protein